MSAVSQELDIPDLRIVQEQECASDSSFSNQTTELLVPPVEMMTFAPNEVVNSFAQRISTTLPNPEALRMKVVNDRSPDLDFLDAGAFRGRVMEWFLKGVINEHAAENPDTVVTDLDVFSELYEEYTFVRSYKGDVSIYDSEGRECRELDGLFGIWGPNGEFTVAAIETKVQKHSKYKSTPAYLKRRSHDPEHPKSPARLRDSISAKYIHDKLEPFQNLKPGIESGGLAYIVVTTPNNIKTVPGSRQENFINHGGILAGIPMPYDEFAKMCEEIRTS